MAVRGRTQVQSGRSREVYVGSLEDVGDITAATDIIMDRGAVAAQVWGVFGLWADGANDVALDRVLRAKGDPEEQKKFSTMMFSGDLMPLVDLESVHPGLASLISDSERLGNLIGSLIHLRLPLREEQAERVPSRMRSRQGPHQVIHNLDPTGHPIANLISRLRTVGVEFPAVTTANKHDVEAEITGFRRAISFCKETQGDVPMVLVDSGARRPSVKGSFMQVDATEGLALREGIFPVEVAEALLGMTLGREGMKPARYPHAQEFRQLASLVRDGRYPPGVVRELIHGILRGAMVGDM